MAKNGLTELTLSDLLPEKEYHFNVMPARACSWSLNGYSEASSTEATINYNRKPRGRMWKKGGEWFGELRVRIRVREGDIREVYGFALEGYADSRACGNQVWYKFRKSALEQGLVFR